MVSAPETEFCDDGSIALDVVVGEIVEKTTTASDEHQEPSATVVVLLVHLEVLGEVIDALTEKSDLHFWRPGIGVVEAVVRDGGRLV